MYRAGSGIQYQSLASSLRNLSKVWPVLIKIYPTQLLWSARTQKPSIYQYHPALNVHKGWYRQTVLIYAPLDHNNFGLWDNITVHYNRYH